MHSLDAEEEEQEEQEQELEEQKQETKRKKNRKDKNALVSRWSGRGGGNIFTIIVLTKSSVKTMLTLMQSFRVVAKPTGDRVTSHLIPFTVSTQKFSGGVLVSRTITKR